MSDTLISLRRQTASAGDLQSVVRTMKAMAAASIGQYEASVSALADYYRIVELGLGACFRESDPTNLIAPQEGQSRKKMIGAVVFGSDQGLVGQFNDVIADYAIKTLATLSGTIQLWAVGERVHANLSDAGIPPVGLFEVPNSVQVITPLIGRILIETETQHAATAGLSELYLFYNRTKSGATYEPVSQRLLPLDDTWRGELTARPWPTKILPEVRGSNATLRALIREYLFVSLFRACAESLASENASRLAAMQRADKNIDELLEDLKSNFQRLRQSGIDEELFDVISGYESLGKQKI